MGSLTRDMILLKSLKTTFFHLTSMGPSPVKPGSDKSPGPVEGVHYGVYLPPDVQPSSEDIDGTVVFTDKSEALKLVKKYKKARFKAFRTLAEATQFALFGLESMTVCASSPPDVGEKPSPFRGPKPQDMVRFRKAIESGDLDFVKRTVWENPRYLVSSGDTPAILQEGSRYNALHMCAKVGNAAACAFILQTISSPQFMYHLYSSGDVDQRCGVLLDLYLNTPDKALNETPLHFASKFGASRVVQVLVAYPQCDRTAINKFHQTAKDIICTRMAGADSSTKEEISAMLEEQFYVPVLRSPDHSIQPVVGKPFSPSSPLQQEDSRDIMSPVMEVQAVAGPMPRQTAELFRRRWKTPPRSPLSPLNHRRPTLIDQDKGWERVGRELAQEWKVAWKEYWPFLDTYVDLNSPGGLQTLEDYLRKRFKNASEGTGSSPGSTEPGTPPLQLNGVSPQSPVSELCSALRACRLSSGGSGGPRPPSRHPPPPRPTTQHNGDARHADDSIPSLVTSPHLYMEKSCQVFAKRIADGFQLGDMAFLWTEVNHLNMLVSSCRSDDRFSQLDLQRLHTRIGQAVAQRLDPYDVPQVINSLGTLVERRMEECYSSEEDEDEDEGTDLSQYRKRVWLDRTDNKSLHNAVVCLARAVLTAVESTSVAGPAGDQLLASEQACADVWSQASPCTCTFPISRNSRRKLRQKRLDFNDDKFDKVNSEDCQVNDDQLAKCGVAPADSSGEESDTSDTSECEFFTPPSSPDTRSDDDQAMESPDEGPDVYINGDTPSKLDMSVMEAIRDSELSKAKYPNICRWRHLVLLHSDHERQSWMSSPKHKSSSAPSPIWHRSPSLNND